MRLATVQMLLLAVALASLTPGGPARAGDVCDPSDPPSCTLRELADLADMRIGATAEPDQVAPGPYADTLVREFNSMTPENALKWYTVQPSPDGWNFGPADTVVDFAATNDLEIRGHTLVWSQDNFTPNWVKAITDAATMQAVVDEHIATVVGRYRDRVHRWDVVNEPLESFGTGPSDNAYRRALGDDWIADVFASAAAADPTAELWLNEGGTDWVPGKHEALVELVRSLVEDGVPIDGVGVQTHRFWPDGPERELFASQLRDFTDLGVEVAITELDVRIDPDDPDGFAEQAGAYERVAAACLSVEGCVEITTWGLTDASTWLDSLGIFPTPTRPLLFDDAYEPKPAYFAVRDVLAAAAPPEPTTTTASTTSTAPSTTTQPAPTSALTDARPATAVPAAPSFTG